MSNILTNNNTYYSYSDFIRNRKDFKVVNDNDIFDNPSALFYKIIFYFNNENGLLGTDKILTDEVKSINTIDDSYKNTAYNYLLLNNEIERAFLLKKFIYLLSNINSNTPWYFQEITGIDTAIERKIFSEKEIKLDENPKQISIKCLNDSIDNRIGTLLDLYRSICFSYEKKKEIIPANLRKFNMGILLFSAPLRGYSGKSAGNVVYPRIPDSNTNDIIAGAKFFEFRNCEFDYNSSKSAYSSLNTSEDLFSPEYTINIIFDDCYESRFNDIMQTVVSDFINAENSFEDSVNNKISKNEIKTLNFSDDKLSFNNADKNYWINTDIEKNSNETLKNYPRTITNNAVNIIETLGNGSLPTLFVSQVNRVANDISQAVQIPKIKVFNENIHNNGTVTRFGRYEYLNRAADGGILGQAVNSFVGEGISEVEQLGKIYLGNIRTMSIEDIEKQQLKGRLFDEMEPRELSNGSLGNINKDIEQPKSDTPDDYTIKKIPGYKIQKTQYLNTINTIKSIRNNL